MTFLTVSVLMMRASNSVSPASFTSMCRALPAAMLLCISRTLAHCMYSGIAALMALARMISPSLSLVSDEQRPETMIEPSSCSSALANWANRLKLALARRSASPAALSMA